MIRDLSETLRAILDAPGLPQELRDAQIVFDRPTEKFDPQQATVDLFLYDIRENAELRSNEPVISRSNGQATIRRSPLRVACSYLVTAWPGDETGDELALGEHRLLSQVLQVLSRHSTIPATFLRGSLVGQEPPLPMMTAQADGPQNPAEFWTALGSRLRASLTVTVTISLEVLAPEIAPIVITQKVSTEQLGLPATREVAFRIGGRVTDAADAAVPGATVVLVQSGLTTTTDAEGQFRLGMMPAGTYTLRVRAGATVQDVSVTVPAAAGDDYDVELP